MARLLTAGAETNDATLEGVALTAGATVTMVTTTVRTGSRSFKCDSGAGNSTSYVSQSTITETTGRTYFLRGYFYFESFPTSDARILVFQASATFFYNVLFVASSSKLRLQFGSTAIGSDSVALNTGQWYRIELSNKIAAGAADAGELVLDGLSVASETGANRSDSLPTEIDWGFVGAPGASKVVYVDDLAFNDDQGANQNSYPGDGKVALLLPTSDNAQGSWKAGSAASATVPTTSATSKIHSLDSSDLSVYETSNVAASTKPILLAVLNSKATTPDIPVVTGCGLVWTQVATVLFDTIATPTKRLSVFVGVADPNGVAPFTGHVFMDFGVTQTGAVWNVDEITNAHGSNPTVQSATNRSDSATSLTVTLGAFGATANGTYGAFAHNLNASALTAGTGFALIGTQQSTPSPNMGLGTEYEVANDTTVDVTNTSAAIAGIAVELRESALYDAINNVPPVGTVSPDAVTAAISNTVSGATTPNGDFNMQTYLSKGINTYDRINCTQMGIVHGEDVSTNTKTGTFNMQSNPNHATDNVSQGGSNQFGPSAGGAVGTYATNWVAQWGTVFYGDAVTVGTAPVARITKTDTGTRAADCCFMGILVDYTPVGAYPEVNMAPKVAP